MRHDDDFTPPPDYGHQTVSVEPETTEQAVERLAQLSPMAYDKVRTAEAEALGVRAATLDGSIKAARKETGGAPKGRRIELYEPEPWPEPVDGAEALNMAYEAIRRHMLIRDEYAITAALWAAHTYVYDVFPHTPRLVVTAPAHECGKTLLMTHLVGSLVTRAQPVELMKAAPFFRMIEAYRPTFLISEVDIFIKEDSDLLAAINNGWEPHGGVPRCVGEGADMEPRLFSTHTPVGLDGIKVEKVLPAMTLSRSLVITLERATIGEVVEPYDARDHKAGLREIGRRLARWCDDHRDVLHDARPDLPAGATGRRADKWTPMFAIAEAAGGQWPERARRAYLVEGDTPLTSRSLQLLSDIREVLGDEEPKIGTKDLIARLSELDESPWGTYNFRARDEDQRHIQDRQLSNLLRDYNVSSDTINISGWRGKGYYRKDLERAFARYLPPLAVTPLHPAPRKAFSDSPSVTPGNEVTDRTPPKPAPHKESNGVTPADPPSRKVRL